MVKREGGHTVELFTSEGGRKGHCQVGRVFVQSALLTKATTKWQNRVVVKVTPPLAMVHHVTLPSLSSLWYFPTLWVMGRLWGPWAGCGGHGQVVGALDRMWGPWAGCGGRGQVVGAVARLWGPWAGSGGRGQVVGACGQVVGAVGRLWGRGQVVGAVGRWWGAVGRWWGAVARLWGRWAGCGVRGQVVGALGAVLALGAVGRLS